MKSSYTAAVLATVAFALPAFAQDKPAATDATAKAEARPAVKRHSHVEEKHHVRIAAPAQAEPQAPATLRHDHRKIHKQGG